MGHGSSAAPADANGRARELLGELLVCGADEDAPTSDAPSPAPGTTAGAEVVLDVAMDGWRYQLLRTAPREETLSLSARELEIARMIANGHTNRTVAVILDISPWTVSTHLRRVYAKLNVGSRAAMAARLVAEGLVSPENGSTPFKRLQYGRPSGRQPPLSRRERSAAEDR